MKVVGAKLDDSDYDRFETFCIDEGISKSEIIRDLIKKYCDACEDDLKLQSEILSTKDAKETPHPEITIVDV